jgi:hypothetical protein
MSIFEPNSTPADESPEIGHEEEAAEQYEDQDLSEEIEQDNVQTEEEESDPDAGHSEEQLLAGKYKNVDELVNGYKNLERAFHTQRNQPKQPQQQPIEQQEPSVPNLSDPDDIIAAINRDPVGTIAQIAQMAYQQARTTESKEQQFESGLAEIGEKYREYIKSDEDLGTFYGKVAEISRELGVNPRSPSPRILRMAAQDLWGDNQPKISQAYKQGKEAARKEQEEARRSKAGLGAPVGARPKETPKTPEDEIADRIVSAGTRKGIFG